MQFPKPVLELVRGANVDFPSNIEDATTEALRGIKQLASFSELTNTLIKHAVHDLVCDDRHSINSAIKRQAGLYYTTPKTVVSESAAVVRAEVSVFLYRIAGTSLGELLGKECLDLAKNEDHKMLGHEFNSKLLKMLAKIVPANKKVKNAIKHKKLLKLFTTLHNPQKKLG